MQEIKTFKDGAKYYYWNNRLHREDGPALINFAGDKYWLLYGEKHREDGPAVEWANGYKEYWLQGKEYSEEEYCRLVKLKALW
jgi:hypothetical protein